MFAVLSLSLGWTLSLCFLVSATEVSVNITAKPGQTVSLSCEAPPHTKIIVVEWIRPELKPEYIFVYRNKNPVPDEQNPSFKNRVELEDGETKDGNVSVVLKNVTSDDAGIYKCKIIQRGTGSRRKRAADTETIKIFNLHVQTGHTAGHREEGGDEERGGKVEGGMDEGKKDGGNTDGKSREFGGLVAGLSVFAVCGFLISGIRMKSKMHMKKNPPLQASPEEKCELQLE